ncbi:hypothetical protein [Actinoplanes derwentensis]|uniref:Lipoprotein n=1 Tax=Actinoplanes derwentensis TaxID=113562 RepID=A0A1H1VRF9_9ACTN|nr:hypothetical protein [Actinoplanes derwentensis]GID83620.1 hypothetical protein Ade03nite_25440 [Actinoplanes derwentensis]SDS87021.1 hypothetical protein SAMN04489716_1843 [Actinoplanes derwentensis]
MKRAAVLLLAGVAGLAACDEPEQKQIPAPATPVVTSTAAPVELKAGEVVLDFPADEADVKRCEIFRGRAALPADKTILIGVRNKDNGNPERYFGLVTDWEYPKDLATWTGPQWFGDKDSAAGQSFRVEILIIDLKLATKLNKETKVDGWHSRENPQGTTVAAHVDLNRVKGSGPADCS